MDRKTAERLLTCIVVLLACLPLGGCFTGIEGTKTITLSKNDKKMLAPTSEELLMQGVGRSRLGEWTPGRPFMVCDERAYLVYESSPSVTASLLPGDTLLYAGLDSRLQPDGSRAAIVRFTKAGDPSGVSFRYTTSRSPEEADTAVETSSLPMLIDLPTVGECASRLVGRHVWTRTPLWYDSALNKSTGLKFVGVDIVSVLPGNSVFPFKVEFRDERGDTYYMFMSTDGVGSNSRSFATLFSLSDPRKRYPHITDEVWDYICRSDVMQGMTKEECRLALGSPGEVSTGHDWSQTMDLWQYNDGVWLRFSDGLLTDFRK